MEINQTPIGPPAKLSLEFAAALRANASDYDIALSAETVQQLSAYYQLINTWNPRLHLVAPCSPDEFARRHILESLLLLPHLPPAAGIVDVGSGAGLPIIPCLIERPDLSAVLIESAKRKAVFLREALKVVGRDDSAQVRGERFEAVDPPAAKFITSRALDRFTEMLPRLVEWAPRPSTLLLFGGTELEKTLETLQLKSTKSLLPNSERRFLLVVELKSET
ncbi:MAG: RsmG family class I SAM-dependent methyltransferase [Pyrinomonadaceae bacterium]